MYNQPIPYPSRPRYNVRVSNSTARSFGWVSLGILSTVATVFLIYFYHVSWLAECVR